MSFTAMKIKKRMKTLTPWQFSKYYQVESGLSQIHLNLERTIYYVNSNWYTSSINTHFGYAYTFLTSLP